MEEMETIDIKSKYVDAIGSSKYHPLIYEKLFEAKLSELCQNLDSSKKSNFFKNLHDSLRSVLSCSMCDTVLRENYLAFSCGHKFCRLCLNKATSCLKCSNVGSTSSSRIKNFSSVLNYINEIDLKFNSDSAIHGLIRFLAHPTSLEITDEGDMSARKLKNPECSTPKSFTEHKPIRKSVQKFTSTSKRIKMLSNKSTNDKRKLEFIRNESPIQTQSHESDSASLFMDLSEKNSRSRPDKKQSSYPKAQVSSNNVTNTGCEGPRKNLKRRHSSVNNSTKEKPDPDLNTISSAKKKKVLEKSGTSHEDKTGSSKSLKRGNRLKQKRISEVMNIDVTTVNQSSPVRQRRQNTRSLPELVSSEADTINEGTFHGFSSPQSIKSFTKFNNLREYYKSLCSKLTDMSSQGSLYDFCPANVVDSSSLIANTKWTNNKRKGEPLNGKKKQKDAINEKKDNICGKKFNQYDPNGKTQKDNDEFETACEILNPSNLMMEHGAVTETKKSETDLKITDKENISLENSDNEFDDIFDVKWSNDLGKKKKKSLFRSVKERSKRNVLLKLLEEKTKDKRSQGAEMINLLSESSGESTHNLVDKVVFDQNKEPSIISISSCSPPEKLNEVLPKESSDVENQIIEISDVIRSSIDCGENEKLEESSNACSDEILKTPDDFNCKKTDLPLMNSDEVWPSEILVNSSMDCDDSVHHNGASVLNTSTPVASKHQLFHVSTPKVEDNHCNNDETGGKSAEPDNEVTLLADVDADFSPRKKYQLEIKKKCANLKRKINDQNQKSFNSFVKNFGLLSPKTLLIQKIERVASPNEGSEEIQFNQSVDDLKCKIDESIVFSPDENTLNYSCGSFSNDILTVPRSSRFKEVACQTTSELHVALLKKEFPHLFNKFNQQGSVYDTPIQSVSKDADVSISYVKTPNPTCSTELHGKYTSVSSVTTSVKKLFEIEFADRSNFDDAYRTPSTIIRPQNTPADVSLIAPLPNSNVKTEEKSKLCVENDKRKLSVRLNFDVTEDSSSIIQATNDRISDPDKTYYYSQKSNYRDNEIQTSAKESENEICSKEIEFSEKTEGKKSSYGPESSLISLIPGTEVSRDEDVAIFSDEEKDAKVTENKSNSYDKFPVKSDDEDVDMIAGTPVSYSKRGLDVDDDDVYDDGVPEDQSNLLFSNVGIGSSKLHSTVDSNRNQILNNTSMVGNVNEMSALKTMDVFSSDQSAKQNTIYLVTSGLKEQDLRIVKMFCLKFSCNLLDNLEKGATHLVVKTDDKNETCRTLKYLQALVDGLCIVSINWLQECINQGFLMDEENFIPLDSSGEQGPLRAYNVSRNLTPSPLSWLRDYCIYFSDPLPQGCTRIQLHQIVSKTGAVVVKSLKELEKYTHLHKIIIIGEEDENVEISVEDVSKWLKTYRAVAIEFNWLLEVIGRNRLISFAEYELVEIPREYLLRLDFPAEMLQQDDTGNTYS